jgi:hypothetical protein
MSSQEVVRGQDPGPETVGIYHGDRGLFTQKDRILNKPRYVKMSQYTGPGGGTSVQYKNMFHAPVDANGNSVDLCSGGYCNEGCGNGSCGNGGCGNGAACNGSCGNGSCNGSCGNGSCNGGSGCGHCGHSDCGECNGGGCCLSCGGYLLDGLCPLCGACGHGACSNGCVGAAYRYLHDGYPTHVHKFSYFPPKDLKYPPPNVPAGVVVYPYYTVKGPDDFFLD